MQTMREYARAQLLYSLRRLTSELHRAPKAPDSEAVHDMRVAIRRFLQVSRVFRQFVPLRELKRIKKKLRRALDLSAEVRNRDIAVELMDAAGVVQDSELRATLVEQRRKAHRRLAAVATKWNRKDTGARWRAALGL